MKIFWLVIIPLTIIGLAYYFLTQSSSPLTFTSPLSKDKPKPWDKYTFEHLRAAKIEPSGIKIGETISDEAGFTAKIFSYEFEGKTITGQINLPKSKQPTDGYPVILMLRGYIDPEGYKTGDGTRKAAAVYARNGFLTLAPDFLGYGGSDPADTNTIAARITRPAEVQALLSALNSLPMTNSSKMGLWGHSNGGQIALSVLEITGQSIPATLWAPVSKPFPYSILYYTDDYDDLGKEMRKVIAQFEQDYDVDLYSIHRYYDWIQAPIIVHQGSADDAVPKTWSDDLVSTLKDLGKDVTYYNYPGADHNLTPSWNTVVQRDVAFFDSKLK